MTQLRLLSTELRCLKRQVELFLNVVVILIAKPVNNFFYKPVKCQARNIVLPDIQPLWLNKKGKTKCNIIMFQCN